MPIKKQINGITLFYRDHEVQMIDLKCTRTITEGDESVTERYDIRVDAKGLEASQAHAMENFLGMVVFPIFNKGKK